MDLCSSTTTTTTTTSESRYDEKSLRELEILEGSGHIHEMEDLRETLERMREKFRLAIENLDSPVDKKRMKTTIEYFRTVAEQMEREELAQRLELADQIEHARIAAMPEGKRKVKALKRLIKRRETRIKSQNIKVCAREECFFAARSATLVDETRFFCSPECYQACSPY